MWNEDRNVMSSSSGGRGASQGKAIWEFDGAQWKFKQLTAHSEGVPGDPPSVPGRFKGQLRATPCVERETV